MMRTYEIIDSYRIKNLDVKTLKFEFPLSYFNKSFPGVEIQVVANLVQKYDANQTDILPSKPKLIAFIQGGPGFPCSPPASNLSYINEFISRGYQMVFMDQRGTGLSTPLNSRSLSKLVPKNDMSEDEHTKALLDYVLNFTGASIVEDMDFIRKELIGNNKWSIVGQSFGGFCSFIYLSKYPGSIKESLITGGIPPVNHGPDDVYTATYQRCKERNIHYYEKYPKDVERVRVIMKYLKHNKVTLPDSGTLSVERFQQIGLNFGGKGGTDSIHTIVNTFYNDLKLFGEPGYNILNTIQGQLGFDTNILYALFQESIYCDGNNPTINTSNWSAERLRYLPEHSQFVFDEKTTDPVFFTGEMVYKSMYDDYVELRPFKKLADALHSNTNWPKLYDAKVLGSLEFKDVPIVGAMYFKDLYVDFNLGHKVITETFQGKNFRPYVSSQYFHSGARDDPVGIIGTLFELLESEID